MSGMLDIQRSAEGDPHWLEFFREFVQSVPSSRERKIAEAKAWLGSKWVLHPANAVKRKAYGSAK